MSHNYYGFYFLCSRSRNVDFFHPRKAKANTAVPSYLQVIGSRTLLEYQHSQKLQALI